MSTANAPAEPLSHLLPAIARCIVLTSLSRQSAMADDGASPLCGQDCIKACIDFHILCVEPSPLWCDSCDNPASFCCAAATPPLPLCARSRFAKPRQARRLVVPVRHQQLSAPHHMLWLPRGQAGQRGPAAAAAERRRRDAPGRLGLRLRRAQLQEVCEVYMCVYCGLQSMRPGRISSGTFHFSSRR